MDDTDIQSPRPFNTRQIQPEESKKYRGFFTKPDPMQVFDYSDSAPHYQPQRSKLDDLVSPSNGSDVTVKPSEQLDLSMLDIGSPEPRKPLSYSKYYPQKSFHHVPKDTLECVLSARNNQNLSLSPCVSPLPSSKKSSPPQNIIAKDNSFFIRRENLENLPQIKTNLRKNIFLSGNEVVSKKHEMMKIIPQMHINNNDNNQITTDEPVCFCHHCKVVLNRGQTQNFTNQYQYCCSYPEAPLINPSPQIQTNILEETTNICHCNKSKRKVFEQTPKNVVDKKKWCIENYKQSTSPKTNELQRNLSVTKEKREPTVADLFRIIKLQNEQLQLLQDKVDRFITTNNNTHQTQQCVHPIQNYVTEQVTLETTKNTHQQISIGVMTSFEMIRTSTVINKDVNANRSAQIQCNRSHISVKEVISQQPVNVNFLDGLKPIAHSPPINTNIVNSGNDNNIEEKLNEFSLCNVQVDNASTPSLSPEQTMYLDVRDYSGSNSNSSDQSNVGWTYYNKVMTHVNGMLQESDMPSSASALFRNTRQHCMQMQIDKTNVSVTKRVTFGEDLHIQKGQGTPNQPTTDTSMKMNQLAAKYLKQVPAVLLQPIPKAPSANQDHMSFATRNYMERHHLLPGMTPLPYQPPPAPASPIEMPRFLDITALKQQPKFL